MLKTPNKMHGAILVTDSFGSVNDQMQEHCALAHAARVDGVVVFLNINKSYGLEEDEDTTKNLKRDIREFLYKVGFGGKGVPISHGSALEALEGKGEGVAGICEPASDLHAWIRENPMQSINSAMY
jgi:translation elongation factor EF-Tu-like GTPase